METDNILSLQIQRVDCLKRALEGTRHLLEQNPENLSYEEIHSVKSILYAAIERVGVKTERLTSVQRMLRELFAIVTSTVGSKEYERKVGIQILRELNERYGKDL